MKRIFLILTVFLVAGVTAWSQNKTAANNFIERSFTLKGTVLGKDKSKTFSATAGDLIIVCENNEWFGKGVAVRFQRSTEKEFDNGYSLFEDSKARNRWGYQVNDGIEVITLYNVNNISETEVLLSYHPDKTLEATYRMWSGDDDTPFVEYQFKGKCQDWQKIKSTLCDALPYVAIELVYFD